MTGYKTNHSLRATAATRLFHAGVDEQLIMEWTGHRSLDGVRSYKRTSEEQQAALSDIINMALPGPQPPTSSYGTTSQQLGAQLSIQGCANCTININYGPK